MSAFVQLYEERKMGELKAACQQMLNEGNESFEVFAYMSAALAAKNSMAVPSMEQAMEMFEKAAALCASEEQSKELCEMFVKEVRTSVERANDTFSEVAMTADSVQAYRDCMRVCAEALILAADLGKKAGSDGVAEVWKLAVSCMVKLCAVYRFEQDLGKVKVKKVSNAPDDIREIYVAKYDEISKLIQAGDASYIPEEIQRERVDAEHPEKKPEETAPDGKPKKKRLIDRLLDFF